MTRHNIDIGYAPLAMGHGVRRSSRTKDGIPREPYAVQRDLRGYIEKFYVVSPAVPNGAGDHRAATGGYIQRSGHTLSIPRMAAVED